MAKSRIGAIDKEFRTRIVPTLLSWGFTRHPNDETDYGRSQFGYTYEFADLSDLNNVKLCACSIYTKDASIMVEVDKGICIGQLGRGSDFISD